MPAQEEFTRQSLSTCGHVTCLVRVTWDAFTNESTTPAIATPALMSTFNHPDPLSPSLITLLTTKKLLLIDGESMDAICQITSHSKPAKILISAICYSGFSLGVATILENGVDGQNQFCVYRVSISDSP